MLPLQVRVDRGDMAMKGYSTLTKSPPSDCLVSYTGHFLGERSYLFAEMQSVYSTAPANWAQLSKKVSKVGDYSRG